MKFELWPSTLDDARKPYNWRSINRYFGSEVFRRCDICAGPRDPGEHRTSICNGCYADLPWRDRGWTKALPYVDGVWACFDFLYPVRQLIHRGKFDRELAYLRLLGELTADRLCALDVSVDKAAVLYPVPLARMRMLKRGYNQAVELSLPIAARLGLRIDEVSVYKPRARLTQSSLGAIRRRANIRDAFKLRHKGASRIAVIVDDVITTGATVSAMAEVLKSGGATTVYAWTIAAA